MLLFKKKFLDAIRAGQKTQTVRLWKHCMMRTGQRSYIPGAGYIRVTAVDPIELPELTDHDAVLDGFTSAEALRAELQSLYTAQLAAGHRAYRVRFALLDPAEQLAASAAAREKKAARRAAQAASTPSINAKQAAL